MSNWSSEAGPELKVYGLGISEKIEPDSLIPSIDKGKARDAPVTIGKTVTAPASHSPQGKPMDPQNTHFPIKTYPVLKRKNYENPYNI